MRLPERIETARLVLRRPLRQDAEAIFSGWASNEAAVRFMSWAGHTTIADAHAFLDFSNSEWDAWPAGPYIIELGSTGAAIGSSGFAFVAPGSAEIGYILAPDAWGAGYATECVGALVEAAGAVAPITLGACVHPDNRASLRVLEECGFHVDGEARPVVRFPNSETGSEAEAVRCVVVVPDPGAARAHPNGS